MVGEVIGGAIGGTEAAGKTGAEVLVVTSDGGCAGIGSAIGYHIKTKVINSATVSEKTFCLKHRCA